MKKTSGRYFFSPQGAVIAAGGLLVHVGFPKLRDAVVYSRKHNLRFEMMNDFPPHFLNAPRLRY